jgi:hypothetical protein
MTIRVFAKAYDLPAALVDACSKEADKLSGNCGHFFLEVKCQSGSETAG